MSGYLLTFKTYLIKNNQFLEPFKCIFGDMFENVYVELCISDHDTQEEIENLYNKILKKMFYDIDGINMYPLSNIILETKSGHLVKIFGNYNGCQISNFTFDHKKVDVLPERIEF